MSQSLSPRMTGNHQGFPRWNAQYLCLRNIRFDLFLFEFHLFLSCLVIASCSAKDSLVTETQPPLQTATPLLVSLPPEPTQTSAIYSPLITPTSAQLAPVFPTPINLTPEMVQKCPSTQKVLPGELGIPVDSRLILGKDFGLASLDLQKNTMKQLSIQGAITLIFTFQVNPDRKWFAYFSRSSRDDNENNLDLWVSTMDGHETWKVAESQYVYSEVLWSQPDVIAIWQSAPYYAAVCPRPVLQVFPFKKTVRPFTPEFPVSGWPNCQITANSRWVNPDYSGYVLFNNAGWQIFAHPSGELQDAFPWLPEEGMGSLGRIDMKWTEQGINIIRLSMNGLQYLLDLQPRQADDPNAVFKEVEFPNPRIYESISWWSEDGYKLALDLYTPPEEADKENPPKNFVILDMQRNILNDYCYDRGETFHNIYPSPDARFLAWTKYEGLYPYEIVVLDTNTGRLAEIESDYTVVGWGRIK